MEMFFKRLTLGDMTVNCYIVADENTKNAVLFDAPDEAGKILSVLEDSELKLCYVILTHAHFDHILALHDILEKTGARLLLHESEEKYLNNPDLNLSSMVMANIPQFSDYRAVKDGEYINLDGIEIKVLHTPGHTEGSACYLMDDILVSGDTLFQHSIGRADFPLGNFDDEIASIKNKLMVLDDNIHVYPGHGFSTTIGRERKENPYLI